LAVFRYASSPIIDEITVRKTEGGAVRAYLHARAMIDESLLREIQSSLVGQGLQCVPTSFNGKPVLEVRGFKDELQLTRICAEGRWISGAREKVVEQEDYISPLDKFRKHTLQAAGASFVVGDLAFMRYGYKGASPLDFSAGAFYSLGTLSSLIFGRKDPSDLHIKDISKRMAAHMRDQQITLDSNSPLQQVSHQPSQGKLERADEVLRHYPAEMMNLFYAMAGLSIALASHKKLRSPIDVQTFANNVAHYNSKLNEQAVQLKGLLPSATGELKRLVTSGLEKIEGGQWLRHFEVDAIEHHTGELEYLRKVTRTLNAKVPKVSHSGAMAEAFRKELQADSKMSAPKKALLQQDVDKLAAGSPVHALAVADTEKHHKHESWMDIGLGATTLTAGLFGTLVKEKAPDPDKKKEGFLGSSWEWVQAHPLSVTAAGYMVSTFCHAVSTAIAHVNGNNERRKTVLWRGIFVGSNVLAEILMSISSKGHGSGIKSDKSVDDTVISMSAETIARQPQAMQSHLIDYVSGFLSRDDVLAVRNDELKQRLQTAVEEMHGNPWATALRQPVRNASVTPEATTPGATTAAAPAWQTRVQGEQSLIPASVPGH